MRSFRKLGHGAPAPAMAWVTAWLFGLVLPALAVSSPTIQETDADLPSDSSMSVSPSEDSPVETNPAQTAQESNIFHGREYLVPALAENSLAIGDGPRPFLNRIAFSPGYGQLGSEKLFVFRGSYHPNSFLGWEATLGHNPADTVHAVMHSLSALVRYPIPWRVQPYGAVGYGMLLVFPGDALNADPVTKNALTLGGGLELYVRDDVAIRFDSRYVSVLDGSQTEEDVAVPYAEFSVGLSFYRGLGQ